MAKVDWDRVEEVFQAALAAPENERRAIVARAAAGDAALTAEVVSLLAAHDDSRTGAFLEPIALSPPLEQPARLEGSRIGPYELVRELGRGGMGEVYLGRRVDGVFQHQVAVKLARAAVPGAELSRRLAAERAILAALHHPHIVTLLDGGTTPTGQPYLITEYIDGEPITVYTTSRRLPLDARLRLFREVCAGVHAAHLHGVVHRDLKPENILVTADGNPKILDFGIAKLLGASLFDQTPTGGLPAPMTPSYASPEQLRGQAVTVASDVYALGVLMHELVTGTRPYESRGRPLDEVLTEILSGNTTRPSAAAARRPADLPYDPARLRGDLDAIVLRAMRVEPEARYASADELARDIDRFLDGQPIEAREPTLRYLVGKIVARHRAATVVAALALIGIVAALGIALWQRQQADAARMIAEERFALVRQIANTVIFKLDEAVRTQSPTEARRVIVSEALQYLNTLAARSTEPLLRIEIAEGYRRIGEIQGAPSTSNLGDRAGALASTRQALALAAPLESDPVHKARVLAMLVAVHRQMAALQSPPESLDSARATLEAAERWTEHERTDASRRALAVAHFALTAGKDAATQRVHYERAGQLFEELLAERPDDPDRMRNVALVDKYLADVYDELGERELKLRRARRAAELDARRLPLQPTNRQAKVDAAISFAQLANNLEDADERLEMYEKSYALRDQVAREDPSDRFAAGVQRRAIVQVAEARLGAGDPAGARALALRSRAAMVASDSAGTLEEEAIWRARSYLVLATLDGRERRPEEGCRWLRQAEPEITAAEKFGHILPNTALPQAREALPGCR